MEGTTIATSYRFRFRAYARAHGRTPDAAIAHDREIYPSSAGLDGFVLWIRGRWSEFTGKVAQPGALYSQMQHDAFDRWLSEQTGEPL